MSSKTVFYFSGTALNRRPRFSPSLDNNEWSRRCFDNVLKMCVRMSALFCQSILELLYCSFALIWIWVASRPSICFKVCGLHHNFKIFSVHMQDLCRVSQHCRKGLLPLFKQPIAFSSPHSRG